MTAIYKEFTLSTPAAASVMIQFLRENAGGFVEKGMPLRVLITSEEKKRNVEQNRFYWGGVLKAISEQACVPASDLIKMCGMSTLPACLGFAMR